jgi:hypothetical protein
VDAEEVAAVAEGLTRRLDRSSAEVVAKSGNTAAVVQTFIGGPLDR